MIPRRFRNWIFFWTPVTWLVLELITYPKNIWWSQGAGVMLKGFFASTVADYPTWVLVVAAVVVLAAGILGLVRKTKAVVFNWMIVAIGVVFVVWAFLAGGGASGWSAGANAITYDWVFQTLVVVLVGVAAYFWARGNPERAELLTWNTHQVWRLYRGNWQGMLGLGILLFFIFMALFAPFLISHGLLDPNAQITGADGQLLGPYHPPTFSWQNLFGTDQVGQSVLAQFIWSARISLIVGLLAAVGSTVVGAGIGIMAGFYGGWQGEVWMRLTDAFLVIPWLPLAMVLAAAWGQNYGIIILIIAITSWPGTARVIRSDVLRVRELQFIERARAIGSSNTHIMRKHALPNVMPLIFANLVLVVAIAILSETTLSFLGLGDPLNFSWGSMLRNAWINGAAGLPAWWYLMPPGIAIVLVVLSFTFIGTAYDEVLDPKLRKREDSGTESRFAAHTETPVVAMGGAGVGGGAAMFTPGQQTDDAMPDFDKPAGGSIGSPDSGGWVGGHIQDDEEGGEDE